MASLPTTSKKLTLNQRFVKIAEKYQVPRSIEETTTKQAKAADDYPVEKTRISRAKKEKARQEAAALVKGLAELELVETEEERKLFDEEELERKAEAEGKTLTEVGVLAPKNLIKNYDHSSDAAAATVQTFIDISSGKLFGFLYKDWITDPKIRYDTNAEHHWGTDFNIRVDETGPAIVVRGMKKTYEVKRDIFEAHHSGIKTHLVYDATNHDIRVCHGVFTSHDAHHVTYVMKEPRTYQMSPMETAIDINREEFELQVSFQVDVVYCFFTLFQETTVEGVNRKMTQLMSYLKPGGELIILGVRPDLVEDGSCFATVETRHSGDFVQALVRRIDSNNLYVTSCIDRQVLNDVAQRNDCELVSGNLREVIRGKDQVKLDVMCSYYYYSVYKPLSSEKGSIGIYTREEIVLAKDFLLSGRTLADVFSTALPKPLTIQNLHRTTHDQLVCVWTSPLEENHPVGLFGLHKRFVRNHGLHGVEDGAVLCEYDPTVRKTYLLRLANTENIRVDMWGKETGPLVPTDTSLICQGIREVSSRSLGTFYYRGVTRPHYFYRFFRRRLFEAGIFPIARHPTSPAGDLPREIGWILDEVSGQFFPCPPKFLDVDKTSALDRMLVQCARSDLDKWHFDVTKLDQDVFDMDYMSPTPGENRLFSCYSRFFLQKESSDLLMATYPNILIFPPEITGNQKYALLLLRHSLYRARRRRKPVAAFDYLSTLESLNKNSVLKLAKKELKRVRKAAKESRRTKPRLASNDNG